MFYYLIWYQSLGSLLLEKNTTESHPSDRTNRETEQMATSTLGGYDNSTLQLTREWAQSIKLVIQGKGKIGYFIGDNKKPNDPSNL